MDSNVEMENVLFLNNHVIDGYYQGSADGFLHKGVPKSSGGLGISGYEDVTKTVTLTKVLFEDNSCTHVAGGAAFDAVNLEMLDVKFKRNTAHGVGGGFIITAATNFIANNVLVENNLAGDEGGGLALHGFSLSNNIYFFYVMSNCRFVGNGAQKSGGAMAIGEVHSTLIKQNQR
eukprot:gene15394-18214_t